MLCWFSIIFRVCTRFSGAYLFHLRIKLLKVCSCDSGSGEQHSITAMVYSGHCCPERFALMQMHDSLSMHIPLGSQES